MQHFGQVLPYDSRMVIAPVVDPVSGDPWSAYLFCDCCQVPHGQKVEALLTFVCEDGQYKFVQGLTDDHKAFMHAVGEVFSYVIARAPPPVYVPGETAETCYDAILNYGTYSCSVHSTRPPQIPAPRADPPTTFTDPWVTRHVLAVSDTSMYNEGFVLFVKGRPAFQPFFQASVYTTQFVFSTMTCGEVPYAYYLSREDQGLDTLCNDIFLPHAIPDAILSCGQVAYYPPVPVPVADDKDAAARTSDGPTSHGGDTATTTPAAADSEPAPSHPVGEMK
jgi:hypothetical protein